MREKADVVGGRRDGTSNKSVYRERKGDSGRKDGGNYK